MSDAKIWEEKSVNYIDVRDMEAPGPLIAILELIENPCCGDEVIVIHHRDPVYLLPELVERNWSWMYLHNGPGEVRLQLSRCIT